MNVLGSANLALRFVLELCAVAAFGYWGVRTGSGTLERAAFGVGVPLVVIAIWATLVAPRRAVPLPEPIAFTLGLIVLGLAAGALAHAGAVSLAVIFAAGIVVNAALLVIWK